MLISQYKHTPRLGLAKAVCLARPSSLPPEFAPVPPKVPPFLPRQSRHQRLTPFLPWSSVTCNAACSPGLGVSEALGPASSGIGTKFQAPRPARTERPPTAAIHRRVQCVCSSHRAVGTTTINATVHVSRHSRNLGVTAGARAAAIIADTCRAAASRRPMLRPLAVPPQPLAPHLGSSPPSPHLLFLPSPRLRLLLLLPPRARTRRRQPLPRRCLLPRLPLLLLPLLRLRRQPLQAPGQRRGVAARAAGHVGLRAPGRWEGSVRGAAVARRQLALPAAHLGHVRAPRVVAPRVAAPCSNKPLAKPPATCPPTCSDIGAWGAGCTRRVARPASSGGGSSRTGCSGASTKTPHGIAPPLPPPPPPPPPPLPLPPRVRVPCALPPPLRLPAPPLAARPLVSAGSWLVAAGTERGSPSAALQCPGR